MVVEGVRTLHDADFGIGKEADGAHQEIALGHEIGIENRDEFAAGVGQRVIDIAGFGAVIVGAREITGAFGLAERL